MASRRYCIYHEQRGKKDRIRRSPPDHGRTVRKTRTDGYFRLVFEDNKQKG